MTAIDIRLALEAWADNGNLDRDHIPEIAREIAALASSPGKDSDSEIIEALLANEPFVFDPATNFIHADDGGAPDHGIKYIPASMVTGKDGGQEVEAVKYEARICKGVPADCCDYGVVDLEEGIEVCRVWKKADARLIADLLNGTVWPEPTEDGDDLTECFRHHVRTAIGWQAFGARPGPEMQMYEEGFKAGYHRCQSDNEPEFGEEEAPHPASTAMVERLGLAWAAVGHHEGIEISVHADAADTWNALCAILDPLARSALSASQSTSRENEQ